MHPKEKRFSFVAESSRGISHYLAAEKILAQELSFFTNFVGAQFIKDSFRSDVAEVSDLVRVFPDRFDIGGNLLCISAGQKSDPTSPFTVIFRKRHNNLQYLIRLVRCARHKSGYFLSPCHSITLAFPLK
jgi:hypothetical protein